MTEQEDPKPIRLAWHLGLGDAITFAPLVMQLAFKNHVIIPCWKHNFTSVRSIFPLRLVTLKPIENEAQMAEFVKEADIKLGAYNGMTEFSNYIERMWQQTEMDYSQRWLYCPIKGAAKIARQFEVKPKIRLNDLVKLDDYIFIHDDATRDYNIRRDLLPEPQVVPIRGNHSILCWAQMIMNAKEIHVIDSSFFHFCEALEPKGKLFLHAYARTEDSPILTLTPRLDWTVYKDEPQI
jgi:hypothetical protein